MRASEFIAEGGYASTLTQGTKITPAVVESIVDHYYPKFIKDFNRFLAKKNMPPVEGGNPVGSTFYYKRDLINNPEREYGDIDVKFFVPKLPNHSDAAVATLYANLVKEFSDTDANISTDTGKNVIFKIDRDQYVQIDLVMNYYENAEWMSALTPEYNVKGIIGMTVYSSLAELLNLSISAYGVQAKLRGGEPVSFRQSKNTELVTVSKNPGGWAVDILKFYANLAGIDDPKITADLKQHPGSNPEEIRIADNVAAVKALGHSLAANSLFAQGALRHIGSYQEYINDIVKIYTQKIDAAINSSKFDKAVEPEAAAKAAKDKEKLRSGLAMVQGLFK